MFSMDLRQFLVWTSITIGAILAFNSPAAEFPTKPIRMVHSAAAGSSGDILGRYLATFVSKILGQSIYVENIAGTGGTVGLIAVAKAPADGHTLLQVNQAHPLAENLYTNLQYKLAKDFAPITQLATGYYILNIHPSVPARTLEELIRFAKAKPGQLNIGIAGNGSGVHLAAVLLQSSAGIDIQQVPYKGSIPALTAALAGEVQLIFLGVPSVHELVRSGKLRAIGITGPKRIASFPDLPPISDTLPGYDITLWQGIAAPAGTPRPVVNAIGGAYKKVLAMPDVIKKYADSDTDIVGSSPEEFAAYLNAQVKLMAQIVRASPIQME